MFHRAVSLQFNEGTELQLTFEDGCIKSYDIALLFEKYPQLKALSDRSLFTSGRLSGGYGIIWSDELDLDSETVYEDGTLVGQSRHSSDRQLAAAFSAARLLSGLTQKELSLRSGIDQSDISKVERGIANPSYTTLKRLAEAMDMRLELHFILK